MSLGFWLVCFLFLFVLGARKTGGTMWFVFGVFGFWFARNNALTGEYNVKKNIILPFTHWWLLHPHHLFLSPSVVNCS